MSAAENRAHAEALVEALWASGVRRAVVSPGSRSAPLALALAGRAGLSVQVVLDERVAGFVALGMARASGAPVALLCTSGSAGAHYLPAVIEASHSRVPLLILTADRPPELHHAGAGQTVDQQRLFGGFARWFVDLGVPGPAAPLRRLRGLVAQAVDAASGVAPGPVQINVPMREPLWSPGVSAPAARAEAAGAAVWRAPVGPSVEAVAALWGRIEAARRGVLVCGPLWPGGSASRLREALVGLAVRLGWPLLAEPTSQVRYGVCAEAPVVSGYDALLRDEAVGEALAPALVVRFGQAPTSKAACAWLERHGEGRTVLVDACGGWSDFGHRGDALVVSDPAALAEALLAAAPATWRPEAGWWARWAAAEAAARGALEAACAEGPLWEAQVARAALASIPAGGALHVSSSMPVRDLDSFTGPQEAAVAVFASRGANGIDGMVATALGEAAAWPGPVTLLVGDLALIHDAGGLLASSGLGVALTVVVINNGGGGIFEFLPVSQHAERFAALFLTPQAVSLGALAGAAGAAHVAVSSLEALSEALGAPSSGVRVVEVVVERGHNVARHRAAWASVSAAARAALEVVG
jgi:2-succinyl-5-enolpyruvyl-6-hydroxy-3-cyclohexene-1-carboxylate synthase